MKNSSNVAFTWLMFFLSPFASTPLILMNIWKGKFKHPTILISLLIGVVSYLYVPTLSNDKVSYYIRYDLFSTTEFAKQQPPERGYAYFQDFIPNNDSDTRVVVIGGKFAAAEKRMVRKDDFRASGSGEFSYTDINIDFIEKALKISKKLKLLSAAFDFIQSENGEPLIVELSYGFGTAGIEASPGYWDSKINWHEEQFNPQEWMISKLS